MEFVVLELKNFIASLLSLFKTFMAFSKTVLFPEHFPISFLNYLCRGIIGLRSESFCPCFNYFYQNFFLHCGGCSKCVANTVTLGIFASNPEGLLDVALYLFAQIPIGVGLVTSICCRVESSFSLYTKDT